MIIVLSVNDQNRKGILAIRYEIKDLQWIGRDSQGDHYVRPLDANQPNTTDN